MVMALLRRSTGEKQAFDLVATGRVLTAAEALAFGLVSRVLPGDGFEAGVTTILSQLAGTSPTALALTKQQFYAVEGKAFGEAVRLGAQVNALARTTDDFRSAIQQFLKR
jgi:enoyl-CoA hydratase/carnithine racemase